MAISTYRKICAVLIGSTAIATLASTHEASAFLAPSCAHLNEGHPCGPPSLHMTCQRQGNGPALQCRKSNSR
jgi:hypothetical protein